MGPKRGKKSKTSLNTSLHTPTASAAPSPAPMHSPFVSLMDAVTAVDSPGSTTVTTSAPRTSPAAPETTPAAPKTTPAAPKASTPKPAATPELIDSPHESPVASEDESSSAKSPTPPPSPPKKKKPAAKGKGKKGKEVSEDDEDDVQSFVESGKSSEDESHSSMQSLSASKPSSKKARKPRGKEKDLTTVQEEDLAEWYRDHPIFYDKRHPDYKNSEKKLHLDEDKAKELKLTVQTITSWKTSMRTRYSKLTNPGPSGSGARKEKTPRENWIISAFGFLKEHIKRSSGAELSSLSGSRKKRDQDEVTSESSCMDDTPQLADDVTPSSRPPSTTFPAKSMKKRRKEAEVPTSSLSEVASALKSIVASASNKGPDDELPHPMLRSYSDVDETWKSACLTLFLTGLKVPEEQRNEVIFSALAKMHQLKSAAVRQQEQQQQQQFQQQQHDFFAPQHHQQHQHHQQQHQQHHQQQHQHQQQQKQEFVGFQSQPQPQHSSGYFLAPPPPPRPATADPLPRPSHQHHQRSQPSQSQEMSQTTYHQLYQQPTMTFHHYVSPVKSQHWNTPSPSYGSQQAQSIQQAQSVQVMLDSEYSAASQIGEALTGIGLSPAPSTSAESPSSSKKT